MQARSGKPGGISTLSATTTPSPRPVRRWADALAFAGGFLARPHEVGSVIPSSRALERRLIAMAGIERARTIVELGPGTGGTTRALLEAAAPDATVLAIELSPLFHARLAASLGDRRLHVHLGNAERLADVLRARRIAAPDAIVSGVPFSTMPADVAASIARAIVACLAPGGRFVAYQVRGHVARWMRPHLGVPQVAWELINVPPLRTFRWVKPAV